MRDVASASNLGASVLSDILDGRFDSPREAAARLAMTGFDTSGLFAVLTVEGERMFASPTYSSHIGRLMKDVFPMGVWVTFENSFAMLLPLERQQVEGFPYYETLEHLTLDSPQLAAVLAKNSLHAYVSEPFENILNASAALEQCRRLPGATHDNSLVTLHWHHRMAALAAATAVASKHGMRLICDQRVLAAHDYDKSHDTEYIKSIRAQLNHPGDTAAAAAELCVHRNTLLYRLRKAHELFGISVESSDEMLGVMFTITVIDDMPDTLEELQPAG